MKAYIQADQVTVLSSGHERLHRNMNISFRVPHVPHILFTACSCTRSMNTSLRVPHVPHLLFTACSCTRNNSFKVTHTPRVGQNHIYTMYLPYF